MQVKGVPFTTKFYIDNAPTAEAGYINLDQEDGCTIRSCKGIKGNRELGSDVVKGRQRAMKEPSQLINLNQQGC